MLLTLERRVGDAGSRNFHTDDVAPQRSVDVSDWVLFAREKHPIRDAQTMTNKLW